LEVINKLRARASEESQIVKECRDLIARASFKMTYIKIHKIKIVINSERFMDCEKKKFQN